MEHSRAVRWLPLLVLVLVLWAAPAWCTGDEPAGQERGCGKEAPASFVGLRESCSCDIGCDVTQNLVCEGGECICQPDSVVVNQTCLLKSHYNETCGADSQCADTHQACDPAVGRCRCQPGYTETADSQSYLTAICRPAGERGRIGDNCTTVADCNWQLEHASCPASQRVCQCQLFYYGETGGLQCWERKWRLPWGWWIAVCLLSAAVIVIGLALIITCAVKECLRSHQRSRGRVAVVTGDIRDNQPPPPYIAVVGTKSAAYGASDGQQSYMDNYGFTACDLEPYSKKQPL
ncbi:multiple epidermal growth factor-like domains protein 10 [Amphibalanus amphitrite]|uniref:multiple epidermal growth factor-like domains protein 10 n=1 Tax=Amphibalanus amphitrite TaxID=1232801 RepID=UPI001C8FF7EC|nr:multiple epidermal growth factor-like domains protein 10 [Amphibalanus amphitrite]